jgi:phospholipid:diacylglycerol acyltransferase
MNFLRRRNGGNSRAPSPGDLLREDTPDDEDVRVVPAKKLHGLVRKHGSSGNKRRTAWIFVLGGIFGIVVAVLFVGHNEMIDMAGLQDFSLDSILDVLPAGFLSEAKELQVSRYEGARINVCCLHPESNTKKLQ